MKLSVGDPAGEAARIGFWMVSIYIEPDPMNEEISVSETVKLLLEFPKSFVEELWADEAHASVALKEAGVLDLFRQGLISIRKGAELLGISYREFLELASRHQVSIINYEEGWIDRELKAFDRLKKQAT